jgi:hypothetical protein
MTNIVERLRDPESVYPEDDTGENWALENAAADEIERLRAALLHIAEGKFMRETPIDSIQAAINWANGSLRGEG